MKEDTHHHPSQEKIDHAIDNLPGAAVNHADDNADNKELVKERTRTLNNNPRNND